MEQKTPLNTSECAGTAGLKNIYPLSPHLIDLPENFFSAAFEGLFQSVKADISPSMLQLCMCVCVQCVMKVGVCCIVLTP